MKSIDIRTSGKKIFLCHRNQRDDKAGFFHEIGFEQFLMVMSHFRPPNLKTTAEEKEAMRKEKLRCKRHHSLFLTTVTRGAVQDVYFTNTET